MRGHIICSAPCFGRHTSKVEIALGGLFRCLRLATWGVADI